jgi:hypothetical protein
VRAVLLGVLFLSCALATATATAEGVWGGVGMCVTHAWGERSAAGG